MMIRMMLVLTSAVALLGASTPVMAGGCKGCSKIAKTGEGFCSGCGKGKIFGVELASKPLYDALAGLHIDADKIRCPGCKRAAKTSGRCEHCKVGAAHGKFYHSMLAHAVAKGMPYTAEKAAHCGECKKAHQSNGFCTACNMGFVAGRLFKNRTDYDSALSAFRTIVKAAATATKCPTCALAMITDGSCSKCKVKYLNGKKTG